MTEEAREESTAINSGANLHHILSTSMAAMATVSLPKAAEATMTFTMFVKCLNLFPSLFNVVATMVPS